VEVLPTVSDQVIYLVPILTTMARRKVGAEMPEEQRDKIDESGASRGKRWGYRILEMEMANDYGMQCRITLRTMNEHFVTTRAMRDVLTAKRLELSPLVMAIRWYTTGKIQIRGSAPFLPSPD
jgi:hypothetical protein